MGEMEMWTSLLFLHLNKKLLPYLAGKRHIAKRLDLNGFGENWFSKGEKRATI